MTGFALTGSEAIALVVVVILVVFIVGIFLYLARRLRARREQLLGELKGRPELVQDRAYNRLAMARREAEILARTGTEIGAGQALIAQSQAAFDLHQYPRAYELAQAAHESLVNARGAPLRSRPNPATSSGRTAAGTLAPSAATGSASGASASLPKNRAESHFLLGLLDQEIEKGPPGAGPTLEAVSLRDQAQAAFDRGEYSESFRLALRGRRTLGGPVEALPPPPVTAGPSAFGPVAEAEGLADAVAGGTRCTACGHPTLSSEAFCRGCGGSLGPRTCPSCGTPREASDVFCGRCGASFSG